MANWTRERIIEAAKAAAANHAGPLSLRSFCLRAGVSESRIGRLFPEGGWSELRQLAGIPRHPQDRHPVSDEQLLQEFHRVASELGAIPSWGRFAARTTISPDIMRRRFGSKRACLQRYRNWLARHHPESPLLSLVAIPAQPTIASPASPSRAVPIRPAQTKGARRVCGAPLPFHGLRYAPINEQGVVYLFGMVSSKLGLIVEAIQSVYPDCEAKRCLDRQQHRWQHVRIEFEFKSSNFREHGHDPAGCDLIVCWEHDWPTCPVEVIELRSVIERWEG